jgi:hypothetical protein
MLPGPEDDVALDRQQQALITRPAVRHRKRSKPIAAPPLRRGQLDEGSDRSALVVMLFRQDPATRADAAPLPHKAGTAKEIRLNRQVIVATHVAGRINPPQVKIGPKDRKLSRYVGHSAVTKVAEASYQVERIASTMVPDLPRQRSGKPRERPLAVQTSWQKERTVILLKRTC